MGNSLLAVRGINHKYIVVERRSSLRQIERLLPLPEVRGTFRLEKLSGSPLKIPFHPIFEILHLSAGTFQSDASRKPFPFDAAFRGGRGYGDGDLE